MAGPQAWGQPPQGAPGFATGSRNQGVRRKIHIGIDADALEVRAVEMTSNRIGDAPVLSDLLAQIPAEERIDSVTVDGIYDTKGCHGAIAARGADAIVPPRRNARAWKGLEPGLQARNEALPACKRFGRANWKKWSGYHRRSRVEAKMTSQVHSNLWRSPARRQTPRRAYHGQRFRQAGCRGSDPHGSVAQICSGFIL